MAFGSTSDMIGRRYVLQEPLGAGAMGTVHRAVDRLSGSSIALKQVKIPVEQLEFASRAGSSDVQLTLAQEFKLLASLRHPNIISVLDYGFADEGHPYVAMELLENARTITQAARDLNENDRTNLLLQLLQALIYLHRRGILHRDLKPRNVMVVNNETDGLGVVKVLDFGLSVVHGQATSGEVAGTPSYMAPEIWSGKPASRASDLYAFGVIAYELYAGKRPFEGAKLQELYRKVRSQQPDLTAVDAPEDIRFLIALLLSKDPTDRYTDASEVIAIMRRTGDFAMAEETARTRESFLQAATFVGREEELADLTSGLSHALNGHGSAWLLGGESGVGKSRLLDELRTVALVDGAVVLRGQSNREGNQPYAVWRDVVRWLCLTTDLSPDEASILKPMVPDIARLLARDVADAPPISAQAYHARLLSVIESMFLRQKQPLVVILEDLHWGGSESLTLLAQLSRIVETTPLMMIGSYRDDENPTLHDQLPTMRVIHLNRLSEAGTAKLVEAMLGPTGKQEALLRLLQKETEGNIFFLVEMVRALAEEAGELSKIGSGALPTHVLTGGVQGIIRRRLNRVPESARPLLQVAAVAGRQLDLDVIADVLRAANRAASLDSMLHACADAAVLSIEDGKWQFSHNKLRDGVLADLPPAVAQELHRRVAQAIENVYQYSTKPIAAVLAYHWHEAQNAEKEAHYAALAGEQALRNGAFQSARDFLTRALALEEPTITPSRRRGLLLSQLGDVQFAMANYGAARDLYQQSLALAMESSYGWGVATNLNNLGSVAAEMGFTEEAAEHYLHALKTATDIRAVPVALTVLVGMASLLARAGDKLVALEFIALVLNHPASAGQAHYLGERLLATLRDQLPPDVVDAALAAGSQTSLRDVTQRILDR